MKAIWLARSGYNSVRETVFSPIGHIGGTSATEAYAYVILPHPCTITRWRMELSAAPVGTNERFFWLSRESSPELATVLHMKGGVVSDEATFNISCAEGDTLCIKMFSDGPTAPAATEMKCWIEYETDEDDTSIVFAGSTVVPTASGVYYPGMGMSSQQTTEMNVIAKIPGGFTAKKLYAVSDAAPGSGKSFTFTVRKGSEGGALSDQALAVTISDTAVQGSDTSDTVALVGGDKVDFIYTDSGTPTRQAFRLSYVLQATVDGDFALTFKSSDNLVRYPFGTPPEYAPTNGFWGVYQASVNFQSIDYCPDLTVTSCYIEQTAATSYGAYTYTLEANAVDTEFVVAMTIGVDYYGHHDGDTDVTELGGLNYRIDLSGTQTSTGYRGVFGLLCYIERPSAPPADIKATCGGVVAKLPEVVLTG